MMGNYEFRAQLYHLEQCNDSDYSFYRTRLEGAAGSVLIVPCGIGRLRPIFLNRPQTFFMDIEPEMINILREKMENAGEDPACALVGDIRQLPESLYDTIIVPAEAIQMFDPTALQVVLLSIRRALRPAGFAVIDLATFELGCGTPSYFDARKTNGEKWLSWERRIPHRSMVKRYVHHFVANNFIHFLFKYLIEDEVSGCIEYQDAQVRLWRYTDEEFRASCATARLRIESSWNSYLPGPASDATRLIYEVCRDQS